MTEFAWFRLLLRAIGVLLMGLGLPALLVYVVWMGTNLAQGATGSAWADFGLRYLGPVLGNAAQCGLGLYLLFGGDWLVDRCLNDFRGRCLGCGYDLSGIGSSQCPECGLPLRTDMPTKERPPEPPDPALKGPS